MRTPLALLAAAGIVSCSPNSASVEVASPSTDEAAIINGGACTEQEFPTAMALLIDATISFDGFGTQDITTVMCTGTLIAPDVVLTAAHCVDPTGLTFGFGTVERADFYVTFQSDLTALAEAQGTGEPVEIPESAIPAREVLGHPEFALENLNGETVNGPGDFKDVGLVFLDVAIEDVEPELVMREDQADKLVAGAIVDIAGWGQQTQTADIFTPPPPGTVGKKMCGASTINEVGDFEMQIGGDETTTRKCHGDSGGPTYLVIDGQRRVVGITSHAYDSSDCAKGGVDTRVDVWRPWIEQEMTSRCDNGTRAFCDVPGIPEPDIDPGEGEGEGDDDDDDDDDDAPKGCAAVPVAPAALAGLLSLLRRRARG